MKARPYDCNCGRMSSAVRCRMFGRAGSKASMAATGTRIRTTACFHIVVGVAREGRCSAAPRARCCTARAPVPHHFRVSTIPYAEYRIHLDNTDTRC